MRARTVLGGVHWQSEFYGVTIRMRFERVRHAELMRNWTRARNGLGLVEIAPLE